MLYRVLKWAFFVVLNVLLFFFGAAIWTIKNHGFFNALSLPGNYGEEVSQLSRIRESKSSYNIEIGNHQISLAELNWDLFVINQSLNEVQEFQGLKSQNDIKLDFEDSLRKFLLGMVIERKLLYHQVHGDASFSTYDPQRYSRCIEEWHSLETNSETHLRLIPYARYVKSAICERRLLEQYIREKIEAHIAITDNDLAAHYRRNKGRFFSNEKVKIRHILLSDEVIAQRVRSQISTKNFGELAKQYSIAPEGKQGGALGPLFRERSLPVFDRAFGMKVHEISPVVRSDYGYHIIMLEEKHPKGQVPFQYAKSIIAHELRSQRLEKAYQSWIEDALAKLPIGSAKIIW